MTTQMLCGDEVQSAVIDIGHSFTKFGTSGQDLPRHVFRSEVAIVNSNKQHIIGESALASLNAKTDISRPFENGNVNWSIVENILHHGLDDSMRINVSDYPLLFTQNEFKSIEDKMKLAEICFETHQTPGFHICSMGTLAAFSGGRPTSLILDFGCESTRITPVVDGYALNKGIISTHRGCNYIEQILKNEIEYYTKKSITSWRQRHSSTLPTSPLLTQQTSSTPYSFFPSIYTHTNHLFIQDVVRDIHRSICFIPYKPISITHNNSKDEFMNSLNISEYELPDGTIVPTNYNICTVPESIFFPTYTFTRKRTRQEMINELYTNTFLSSEYISNNLSIHPPTSLCIENQKLYDTMVHMPNSTTTNTNTNTTTTMTAVSSNISNTAINQLPLSYLILHALTQCDVDCRKELLNNILLVGGGSVIDGLQQRLQYELNELLPPPFKMKYVSTLPIEKVYGTWIGGSILSICGSFQQCWISKAEYDEIGGYTSILNKCVH